MSRAKNIIRIVTRAAMAMFAVTYVVLATIYVFPLNPLKIALEPILYATIGAYFDQNWSLFAPDPVSLNQALELRCVANANVGDAPPGASPVEWLDITTPMIDNHQRSRLSAYDRVARPQMNAMRTITFGHPIAAAWQKSCTDDTSPACEFYKNLDADARADAQRILVAIGSSYCNETQDGLAKAVHLRVRSTMIRPWSKRASPDPQPSNYHDLGTFAVDAVVPSGMYVAGVRP